TQVYGAIIPEEMTNQALLDSIAYKTYFAIASGVEPPKSRKSLKKSDSSISSEESPSKKNSSKAKKVSATKPKPTKKKAPVKADRGNGLNVLSEVTLSKAAQLKKTTKQSKKDFHISQASGLGDGTDLESGVPDEQHHKTPGTDEGIGTKLGVLDVPKYDSESDKESWGDSEEEDDDDEDVTKDDEGNDANDDDDDDDNDDNDGDDDDDNDANDDDNQKDDDKNDDEEETDSDRTKSDRIKILVLNQSTTEYYEEEEEKQVEEDAHVTLTLVLDIQKTNKLVQSSSVSSDFISKLLNLENPSPVDNEIASLMDTTARHAMVVPEITSIFTTTIPPPPSFFNPLPQQATPTPIPTTSKATTSFPSLPDFSYVFKFNDRVTNLEKDLSEIKQVDQYAQALSSILAIVDHYIDNKLREAIQKAIVAHNLDYREEAQAEKRDYIEVVDTLMRAILKEEKNVTESLEAAVLTRSSSQPKSTYEAAASLSEFELTKILIDKMEKNKSYDKAEYKRELYDALFKSYQTDKDLFDTYGEVFTLKRSRDDRDKDQDPSARSDRETKKRKSSKEAESTRDSRSKEKQSSSTSKDASHFQHKPYGKSAYAEEPSHTVDDSGVQQDQEFDTGNNDEQLADKEVSKDAWFKKPKRPPTPDSDWNKRQHVNFRPP
ncbi:hypothetical protein Tco_0464207, partial [Tanacetum coccineum]